MTVSRDFDPAALVAGPISIDQLSHTVSVNDREVELTATEYKLLLTLVERQGRVQSRAQLLEDVWQTRADIRTRTVDMHVQRLRAKLGPASRMVQTVRGFGYLIRTPVPEQT
jgi:two-component system phosphate regulon response regulator PhoB